MPFRKHVRITFTNEDQDELGILTYHLPTQRLMDRLQAAHSDRAGYPCSASGSAKLIRSTWCRGVPFVEWSSPSLSIHGAV